jgi:hypothetical protein
MHARTEQSAGLTGYLDQDGSLDREHGMGLAREDKDRTFLVVQHLQGRVGLGKGSHELGQARLRGTHRDRQAGHRAARGS